VVDGETSAVVDVVDVELFPQPATNAKASSITADPRPIAPVHGTELAHHIPRQGDSHAGAAAVLSPPCEQEEWR
jgi:hypothetical protein